METETLLVVLTAAIITLVCVLLRLYFTLSGGRCLSDERMDGKTVIVTGANTGIGKETARELAHRGARVILACRSLERGNEAAADIVQSTGSSKVRVLQVDLSSLKSVRAFCKEFVASEHRLDVLVLNAGMVPPPGKFLTEDNYERQFATNHLGHFLLTNLLMDFLRKSAPSRIIAVSSSLHQFGRIDFENLAAFEKTTPDPFFTYCNTKLCNILMVKELARRLQGSGVTATVLHPGLVRTEINRRTPWYIKNFLQPLAYIWAKDSVSGAQTTIFLSVAKEVDGLSGKYFVDCKQTAVASAAADDQELATKLWTFSERLAGTQSLDA